MMNKKTILLGILVIFLVILGVGFPYLKNNLEMSLLKHSLKAPPEPKVLGAVNIATDSAGLIKYPQDYTLVMLGDSMTETLGNSTELKGYLNQYLPNKTFEVLNYGYGSTNILSGYERYMTETNHGRAFRAIDKIDFDLILIESFAYNPLAEYPLEQGLKIQNETLDKLVSAIKQNHPNAKIVFVATIAPDKNNYAKGIVNSSSDREKQVNERRAYLENHISYANSHNLPVVDIYHKSLDDFGNGKTIFIRNTDYIHPSPIGTLFISKEIADFLVKNGLIN